MLHRIFILQFVLGIFVFIQMVATVHAEERKIRIGVIIPLTGSFANYGAIVRQSIEKVQSSRVEWVFEDDACDPAKSVLAFKKLSGIDDISFVIGPCCGSSQKALAPMLAKQKRLVVLPNAAPDSVLERSGGNIYAVQYSVDAEATFLAEQMNRQGLKKVAILAVDNDFSQTMRTKFLKTFKGSVAYSEFVSGYDPQYMKLAALKLKSTDFDSIFLADIGPLFMGLLSELKKLGIPKKPTFSNYGTQMPDILAIEKENAEGLMYSYPNISDSEDAFGYFPSVAAKLLAEVVAKCDGVYECVSEDFKTNAAVQKTGVATSDIILKKIEHGKYVRVAE